MIISSWVSPSSSRTNFGASSAVITARSGAGALAFRPAAIRCRKLHVAIPIRSGVLDPSTGLRAVWSPNSVGEAAVVNNGTAKTAELRFRKSRRWIHMSSLVRKVSCRSLHRVRLAGSRLRCRPCELLSDGWRDEGDAVAVRVADDEVASSPRLLLE